MRLNKEQQKLVSDNHELIYRFLKIRNFSTDAVEDWYGTAAIGLCKAAMIYDVGSGCDFEKLAYIAMNNEVELIKGVGVIDFASTFNLAVKNVSNSMNEEERNINDLIIHKGFGLKKTAKETGLSFEMVKNIHKKFLDEVKNNACA